MYMILHKMSIDFRRNLNKTEGDEIFFLLLTLLSRLAA